MPSSIIFLADLHLGEGCNSSSRGYQLNDTNCYSFRHLNATIAKANEEIARLAHVSPVQLVLVGGDITSSAQYTEFEGARALLERLDAPYLPVLGNHDIWSYDETHGDLTPTPVADELFAGTFAATFASFARQPGFTYPNTSVHDPHHACHSRYQSWELRLAAEVYGADLAGLTFIAPDFNTRARALPPCPGHSPIGGCGVPGNADLHDFTGGAMPWFRDRLAALAKRTPVQRPPRSVFLLTHQPFRCRVGVPDWVFCFSGAHKATVRTALLAAGAGVLPAFWGVLAGHQHRWFNGTAFDETDFRGFRQWENSATKGDAIDHNASSAFSTWRFAASRLSTITRHWQEGGVWHRQEEPQGEPQEGQKNKDSMKA